MNKTATIVKIDPLIKNGQHETWTGARGINYKFTVAFDNGDFGTALSTEQTPRWPIDKPVNYTIEPSQWGNKVRIQSNYRSQGGGGKVGGIGVIVGAAIGNAALICAHGRISPEQIESYADAFIEMDKRLKQKHGG